MYAPGATLDPACAPTDSNCGVQSNTAVGTLGQVPYYSAAGNVLAATSAMTILSNGNIGIGTTSPFTTLSVVGNGYFTGNIIALSASTTNATSTTFYANTISAGNIYAPIQSQNQYVLRSTITKIAAMKVAAPAQLRVVEWGDSIAGFHAGPVITKLKGGLGNAGFIFGGTINSTSGDVVATSADFTSTPTGSYEDIGSGSCVVYGSGGGYVTANKLSLFYIAEPGAGTLTLNTNLNGAGYVAGQSISAANASRVGGVLATTTANIGPWTIQACASGGRVKVFGPGFENLTSNGVITISLAAGGLSLDQMNTPSTAITGPWYTAINPDLVTFEMKEASIEPNGTTYLSNLQTFVVNQQTANPLVDFLLIGSSAVGGDTTNGQIAQNTTLRQIAAANNAVYWDGYGPSLDFNTELSLGWITSGDTVHQTALGQSAESNLLWSSLGLGSLIDATSTNNVNNVSTQTNGLTVLGLASGSNDTGTITFSSPNTTGTQASIKSSWWNGGDITFTAPRDLAGGGNGFVFNSNGGTTRMYIDSASGNVGIGTSTPGSLLSIGGIANFSTATSSLYGTGGINLKAGCFAINGTCLSTSGGSGTVSSGTTGQVPYYSSSGTTVSGTSALIISGTNVGVNNTNPLVTLDVSTSTSVSSFTGTSPVGLGIRQTGNGANYSGIDFFGPSGANGNPQARIAMTTDAIGSYLSFGTTGNWGSGITNTALTISPNGNVGIASTSPAAALGVTGNIYANGNLTLNNNLGMVTFSSQYDGTNGAGFIKYDPANSANLIFNAGRNNYNGFLFQTNVSGAAQTRMTILNGGNVGIGTTTPYSRLTIWGPDAVAGTAAFTIANSASTTEFQVFDNGSATLAGTLTQNSDERLKQNITSLDGSSTLAAIASLNPVSFIWRDPSQGSITQLGFIAQDVQKVFPQLVSTTSATALTPGGTLGINYIGLISPLIEAVKELAGKVSSLAATVAGFADSFTTNNLCVKKSDGSKVCITGDQLNAILQNTGSTGSPQGGQQSNFVTNTLSNSSPITITDVPASETNNDSVSTTTTPLPDTASTTSVTSEEVASTTPAE